MSIRTHTKHKTSLQEVKERRKKEDKEIKKKKARHISNKQHDYKTNNRKHIDIKNSLATQQ